MTTAPEIAVGTIMEDRHAGFYPWESRQQCVVIAVDAESITVRWQPWGDGERIPRDRIGNKMTDLVRLPKNAR